MLICWFCSGDDDEISFDPDDIITNVERFHEGWWQGLGPDGTFGLFPSNYVELLDDQDAVSYQSGEILSCGWVVGNRIGIGWDDWMDGG